MAKLTRCQTSMWRVLACLPLRARQTLPTLFLRFRYAGPSSWPRTGAPSQGEDIRLGRGLLDQTDAAHAPLTRRTDARQQPCRVVALNGAQIGRAEPPVGNPSVHLGAVAERIIRAIHHLGDGYHLEQGGDLTWRVALRELVMEFSHLRQWTIGEMRGLTLHGETDEAAGEEWQRAAAVGEYPP